jgi:excisionase family DNA binding protein
MSNLTKEQILSSIRQCEDKLHANDKWRWDQVNQVKVPMNVEPTVGLPDPIEKFLSVQEVAEILGFCTHTIRAWVKSKRLPAFKVGSSKGEWRFRRADILELAQKEKPDAV